jgi:hypothetical protein
MEVTASSNEEARGVLAAAAGICVEGHPLNQRAALLIHGRRV